MKMRNLNEEYAVLGELYVLGEKYQDVGLKNTAIAAIAFQTEETELCPSGLAVDIIYRGTCVGSPIRKLLVAMHMDTEHDTVITGHTTEEHNVEFLMELCAQLIVERRWDKGIWDKQITWEEWVRECMYHEHGEDGKCPVDED